MLVMLCVCEGIPRCCRAVDASALSKHTIVVYTAILTLSYDTQRDAYRQDGILTRRMSAHLLSTIYSLVLAVLASLLTSVGVLFYSALANR
jgi:hypothetical protein